MPRPKPKRGASAWRSRPHILSDTAKEELVNLLGFDCKLSNAPDQAVKALRKIEKWLGFYPGAVVALKNAPTAADYRETLMPIGKSARALDSDLRDMHSWIRNSLAACKVDVEKLEIALNALVNATESILKEKANVDSRGRPQQEALKKVIGELRKIFVLYYCGNARTDQQKTGSIKLLSERENDEVEFIKIALEDASIQYLDDIRRYFDEPEVALPEERDRVMDKLARRSYQRRIKEKEPE